MEAELSPNGQSHEEHDSNEETDDSEDESKDTKDTTTKDKKEKKKKQISYVAGHRFRSYYFPKPTWCSHCKDFIWGVHKQQGYKCKDCDFGIHYSCIDTIVTHCSRKYVKDQDTSEKPKPKTNKTNIFGTLRGMSKSHSKDDLNHSVPAITIMDEEGTTEPVSKLSEDSVDSTASKSSTKSKSSSIYGTLSRRTKHMAISGRIGKDLPVTSVTDIIAHHGHSFAIYTFTKPSWCSHCNNFIFGIDRQGWRCKNCHVYAHYKCVNRVILPCRKETSTELTANFDQASVRSRRSMLKKPDNHVVLFDIPSTSGFSAEDGIEGRMFSMRDDESIANSDASSMFAQEPVVSNEDEEDWYKLYFIAHDHENFITTDKENDLFVVSIIREVEEQKDNQRSYQYRVIVWLKTGKEQHVITVMDDDILTAGQVLKAVAPTLESKKPKLQVLPPDSPAFEDLKQELLKMESEQNSHYFKFGALYCKPGQTTEEQFFGNVEGSRDFYEFLDLVGERVDLFKWDKFRGGLDTKENLTGRQSYYTEFCGNEIMFHVSTMLPHVSSDTQQLARKRHIGNDIVCLVFVDEQGFKFNPQSISTQFIHSYMIVQKEGVKDGEPIYRINVVTNESVPLYGPDLPYPPIFTDKHHLRSFVLSKLINAEKAAYLAPAFQSRRERTLKSLLEHIQKKYFADAKKAKGSSLLDLSPQTISRRSSLHAEDAELYFGSDGNMYRSIRHSRSMPNSPTSGSLSNYLNNGENDVKNETDETTGSASVSRSNSSGESKRRSLQGSPMLTVPQDAS